VGPGHHKLNFIGRLESDQSFCDARILCVEVRVSSSSSEQFLRPCISFNFARDFLEEIFDSSYYQSSTWVMIDDSTQPTSRAHDAIKKLFPQVIPLNSYLCGSSEPMKTALGRLTSLCCFDDVDSLLSAKHHVEEPGCFHKTFVSELSTLLVHDNFLWR
jgi:hypothetical protein